MPVLEPVPGTTVYLWNYIPNLPASLTFLILYLFIACLLSIRMYITKTWFCSPFIVGCFLEVIGYSARASAYNSTGSLAPYIIQTTFIVIPPAFFAATIYMLLSRIIRLLSADHLSPIHPRRLTTVFVTGDILSFNVQGGAAGLWVHPDLHIIASALVISGLAIQLISFVLFGVCAVVFHTRYWRKREVFGDEKCVKTLWVLYVVSGLIIIRSIFRIVEFSMGNGGYPMTHEWTLYVFDSVPMILVSGIFLVWYPSDLMPKDGDDVTIQLESQASCDLVGRL